MMSTAALLKLYERIYGFAVAILLVASGVAFAFAVAFVFPQSLVSRVAGAGSAGATGPGCGLPMA